MMPHRYPIIPMLVISFLLSGCVKEEAGPGGGVGGSIDKIAGGIYDIQAENNQQNNAQRKAALDRRERELRERERELDRREDEIRDRELGYREERRSPRW